MYPADQLAGLKAYSSKLGILTEGGVDFLFLKELRLPEGCQPEKCDALLCPVPREGYPSRLYFSEQIKSPYTRNWNQTNARIGERNWFAFSWKVSIQSPTLVQLLIAHLTGFTKIK